MESFFNIMNKIMNLAILNFCFLISCVPIVTIGAGLTALYAINLKMVENEEGYVFREFWKAFRDNFKKSTICWIGILMIGAGFTLNVWALRLLPGVMQMMARIILSALFIIYVVIVLYVFPYMARFEDKLRTCVKNALLIGGSNFGHTITVLLITTAAIAITFVSVEVMLRVMFIWLVLGFALLSFVHSWFIRKVFEKYC